MPLPPWLLAAPVALALAGPAAAADATAEQARAVQAQLADALQAVLGASPDPPVRVLPQGDHYDIAVPLAPSGGTRNGPITAQARQGANGVWTIAAIAFPSPAIFTIANPGETVRIATKIAEQDAGAVFDPSGATASSFSGSYRAVRLAVTTPTQQSVSHLDFCTVTLGATPAIEGRTDLRKAVDVTGYSGDFRPATGAALHLLARHTALAVHLAALSLAHGAGAAQAWTGLFAALLGGGSAPPDRGAAHRLVESLTGLMTGIDISESVDGVQADAGGLGFAIDHASLALTAAAPADALEAQLSLDIAGLAIPSLPPEMGGDLVPHHLSLRPVLSGVSMHDLTALALAATAPDTGWPDLLIQAAALLSHGGIGLALENFSTDIGPANLSGTLHANIGGLQRNSGEGHITAAGFDALLTRLRQLPDAGAVLPVLIYAQQLAHVEGDRLRWDVVLENGRVLVNGVDVLAGGRKL